MDRTVTTDPRKVRQVLLNLLGNAVKFTTAGGVTLTVAEAAGALVFAMDDRCPGIRSRRLVTLLNGTICAEAREGSGSSCVLTLPSGRRT
jgi:signal transduction histidine kinase